MGKLIQFLVSSMKRHLSLPNADISGIFAQQKCPLDEVLIG
jgi:hypothetical protein